MGGAGRGQRALGCKAHSQHASRHLCVQAMTDPFANFPADLLHDLEQAGNSKHALLHDSQAILSRLRYRMRCRVRYRIEISHSDIAHFIAYDIANVIVYDNAYVIAHFIVYDIDCDKVLDIACDIAHRYRIRYRIRYRVRYRKRYRT